MKNVSSFAVILYCSFTFFCFSAQSQWIQQYLGSEAAGVGVQQLDVVDSNIVWGVLWNYYNGGQIQLFTKTLNGGLNWVLRDIPGYTGYYFSYLAAVNENTAWVSLHDIFSSSSVLLKTTDGGLTWQELNHILYPDVNIQMFYFWDENKGFATGTSLQKEAIRFYTTEDGGITWLCSDSNVMLNQFTPTESINGHFNIKDSIVKCISSKGRLFTSHDWGKHWTVTYTPFFYLPGLSDPIAEFQENLQHGLIFNHNNLVYETLNGGSTWSQVSTTGFNGFHQFAWIPGTANSCIRISMDDNDGCFYSTDGGHTWTEYPELHGKKLLSTDWYDNKTGWVSEITKDINPTSTGMFRFGGEFVSISKLNKPDCSIHVYPNPCTSEVNIEIYGITERNITFELLNITGQQVFNEKLIKMKSDLKYSLNVDNIPAGIYMASFKTADQSVQKKIVIY